MYASYPLSLPFLPLLLSPLWPRINKPIPSVGPRKKSNIIIKYNQCNSTANCICLSHVATKLLGEVAGKGRLKRKRRKEEEKEGGVEIKCIHCLCIFMEESQRVAIEAGKRRLARSHRLAGHVVNLIWFIFICCAHFFSFFFHLSLLCWPLSIGSGSGSGSCCKFQVEETFALPMRPLGQVYCDGSHKFHFYLRQLTTLTSVPPPSGRPLWLCVWRNNLSL